jgi:hypothetical protein
MTTAIKGNVITSRQDLETALDLPGAPFVSIITRTLKTPETVAWKGKGDGGAVGKHRATGQSFDSLYPKGIRVIRSIVIRSGRSYELDVINQRIHEAQTEPSSIFYGLNADEIREIGYKSEGLHRGKTESIGRHLGRHTKSGQVYFVYSPDQRRDSAEVRAATWERYIDEASGRELPEWEVADVKENLLKTSGKTHKQGVKHDRTRRTLKIENLLQIKAGETFSFDGANFRMKDPD